jgi:hypothetical protein
LSSRLFSKNIKIKIFKVYITTVLPLVLHGCDTWPLTPKEQHILRVSENRVLRIKFGPEREEVAGSWRRLHSEERRKL